MARQMAGEDVGDTFSGCLAGQMPGEDVGDPFPGKSTYDASSLEWMRRFSYPSLRYASQNGGVHWAGISSCYQCNPRFLIKDIPAILGGPSIIVRGRLDPADSNDIQKCTTLADAGEMQEPLSVVHGIDGCYWCGCPDPRYILDLIHTC
ncbi:hypothetical protein Y032_0020g208 [Ancylostoma ceylanicum]|uniref:Uncharacterized protein n=1 Tax=Ancylostoma ceylanicum TaxID=53326 RepID=A0A016V0Y1_9BILA|nr:hypothetical protein Y032_0020g208 [Ancylostoma ceylanicum]